jgi:hypothetical protein
MRLMADMEIALLAQASFGGASRKIERNRNYFTAVIRYILVDAELTVPDCTYNNKLLSNQSGDQQWLISSTAYAGGPLTDRFGHRSLVFPH